MLCGKMCTSRVLYGWAAQLGAILEIMSPPSVFALCIYAVREAFLKMLRDKQEHFHVYFLVIRIQSTSHSLHPLDFMWVRLRIGLQSQ